MGKDSNWGYMPYLTPEQKQVLADLRKRVDAELPKRDWLQKDTELLRFCRARNFNPTKTWNMLKEDVEWREPWENYTFCKTRDFGGAYAMHEEGAIRLAGKSKDGRPVIMVQARYYWPKLVEDNIQIVYFFTFYVNAICKLAEAVEQETFFAIVDLEGFTFSNFSLPQMKIAISILQNHYPERLGTIYVINAPFVFTAAWRLIQPLLDDRTRNKIEILGSDYLRVVTEQINVDQIEKQWGGTHDKWPIPDPIVQVAIDNEERLLKAQKEAAEAASQSATKAAPASPSSPVSPSAAVPVAEITPRSSGVGADAESTTRRSLGARKTVRRLVRKMLFITEKRALAQSLGADPNASETDIPRRLTSGNLTPSRKMPSGVGQALLRNGDDEDGEVDITSDLEKEILDVKEAHDKLLAKIESLEKLVQMERSSTKKAFKSMRAHVVIILTLIVVVLGMVLNDRFQVMGY